MVVWGFCVDGVAGHPPASRFAGTPLYSPSERGREIGALREGGFLVTPSSPLDGRSVLGIKGEAPASASRRGISGNPIVPSG